MSKVMNCATAIAGILLSTSIGASEKEEYFAKQCYKEISGQWVLADKYQGTKLGPKYSYWPLKKIES